MVSKGALFEPGNSSLDLCAPGRNEDGLRRGNMDLFYCNVLGL